MGINIIAWLLYSLDLNLIKNLWKILKAEIDKVYPELKGIRNSNTVMDFIIRYIQ
jgi:vacuolar-type H+-ATPase catalytic subunit A/Vma1